MIQNMSDGKPTVFVVDDDASVRAALQDLFESIGMQVVTYVSTAEFLHAKRPESPACLVLDIRLPGQSGLEFQREVRDASLSLPIIFISGHGDIPMSVQAMKSGAVEFLTKPIREQQLLDAVQVALERDRARLQEDQIANSVRARYDSLTARERDVFALVVTGRPNKQIAAALDLSEMTVKVHRSNLTRKMGAKSVIDLVRMADRLGISPAKTESSLPKH
jgi:FixJ family two-component response regulator